jgi:NAD(P)-dependent dehydrogenase (short-subunit alcohol dehydrogenase family)
VRQLLLRPGEVVATCRNPTEQGARGLLALQREHGNRLRVLRLDTWEVDSIDEAVSSVQEAYGHINLLLNVSGVLHVPGLMSPETSLQKLKLENMERAFRTNAFGPVLVCRGFLPLLLAAGKEGQATEQKPAVVANLSARVGSIEDNGLGGWYSYRASKAALNQFTKTLSIEAARKGHVAAVALHPGTCDTDLTLPYQKNVKPEKLFSREKGVSQLLHIMDSLTMEDAGRFIAWDGKDVPW